MALAALRKSAPLATPEISDPRFVALEHEGFAVGTLPLEQAERLFTILLLLERGYQKAQRPLPAGLQNLCAAFQNATVARPKRNGAARVEQIMFFHMLGRKKTDDPPLARHGRELGVEIPRGGEIIEFGDLNEESLWASLREAIAAVEDFNLAEAYGLETPA